MFTAIKSELSVLRKKKFSGHVKFGIEGGQVVSESISSTVEKKISKIDLDTLNFENEASFYGTIEYDFDFGVIVNYSWNRTFKGDDLKNRQRENQCKSVRYVIKK